MAESRNLQALVGVRLTWDERTRGDELAAKRGTTLAALLRGMLRDQLDAKEGAPEEWAATLFDQRDAALEAVARVRLIHARNGHFPYYCVNCRSTHPCKTIQVIDGEAP